MKQFIVRRNNTKNTRSAQEVEQNDQKYLLEWLGAFGRLGVGSCHCV